MGPQATLFKKCCIVFFLLVLLKPPLLHCGDDINIDEDGYSSSVLIMFQDFYHDFPGILQGWKLRYDGWFNQHKVYPDEIIEGTPIILIHGYGHNNTAWKLFREEIEKQKLGPVYTPTLKNSIGDIRKSAWQINELIKYVVQKTGQEQVILVGHSMGGLVSAFCAQHYAPRGKVKAVIALGSPFMGTKVAAIGYGEAAFQFRYRCKFVRHLTSQMLYNPAAEYFCIGSKRDELVRPYSSAFAPILKRDKSHRIIFNHVGHSGLLFDDEVIRNTISMIKALDDSRSSNHSKVLLWFRKPFQKKWERRVRSNMSKSL